MGLRRGCRKIWVVEEGELGSAAHDSLRIDVRIRGENQIAEDGEGVSARTLYYRVM